MNPTIGRVSLLVLLAVLTAFAVSMIPTGSPSYDIDRKIGYQPSGLESIGMQAANAGKTCSNTAHWHGTTKHYVRKKTQVGPNQFKWWWYASNGGSAPRPLGGIVCNR